MDDFDDLWEYDGDPVHDMYVDIDYEISTEDQPYVEYDEDMDNFINNLNDLD